MFTGVILSNSVFTGVSLSLCLRGRVLLTLCLQGLVSLCSCGSLCVYKEKYFCVTGFFSLCVGNRSL